MFLMSQKRFKADDTAGKCRTLAVRPHLGLLVPDPEMSGTGLRFRALPLVYNGSIRDFTILGNNGKEPTYVIRNCAY